MSAVRRRADANTAGPAADAGLPHALRMSEDAPVASHAPASVLACAARPGEQVQTLHSCAGACPAAAGVSRSLRAWEWTGCALGLLGAFLLATDTSVSRYGWVAFLVANVAVIVFARGIRANGLLLQQTGFMATSLLGLYRAFVPHA